jgi:potassium channel subfamily K
VCNVLDNTWCVVNHLAKTEADCAGVIDIINVVTVTVFGVEHRFNDGYTYGQAFWLTVCSTIASVATNVNLLTDLIRTPDFAVSGTFN